MPFFNILDSLSHCFVGLDRAFNVSNDNSFSLLSLILIFLAISSANFSADFFVFTKTKACLFLFIVSRTRFITGTSVMLSIGVLGIKRQSKPQSILKGKRFHILSKEAAHSPLMYRIH